MPTTRGGMPRSVSPPSLERRLARASKTADVAAAAVVAVDSRVGDVLSGDEPFIAVNVGGSIVMENGGLADGVVDTAAISITAVRPGAPATNAEEVGLMGLDAIGGNVNAAGAAVLVSTSFVVPMTGDVTLVCGVSFNTTNDTEFEFALLLDHVWANSMAAIRNVEAIDPARYRKITQPDPAGGPASISIVATATMNAGTHTATLLGMDTGGSFNGSVPAGSASLEVYLR